jgi:hypothetical protein
MSDITIVYKTFENDLQWLKYSLYSLKKFVTNYNMIIIYCHNVAVEKLNDIIKEVDIIVTIIPVVYNYHGYIKQMTVKCLCYKDIITKYIVILDSDLIFSNYYNINDLINDDGIIEWRYSEKDNMNNKQGEWKVWKKAYEDMTNTPQNIHFMSNHHPFVFTKTSMEDADKAFTLKHNMNYDNFCIKRLNENNIKIGDDIKKNFNKLSTVFTEFEWLGYYCFTNSKDYKFINIKDNNRKINSILKQYWSHGGITPKIKLEIENILK